MSIPWGESKGDDDLGGYHLVWTRDLVQSASALLATGQHSTPLRALIWLSTIQGRMAASRRTPGSTATPTGQACSWMRWPRPSCWPGG
ncbi:hypothetical protein [Verrucomicrobium spinosum]|uniref:hypothetical protein n=1 Tax=Verrucomicrobium spinosum TaxID=2736 RepID=UPI000A4A3299|nr:hypothetical protein [Verrucomicrobium spinosum]